MRFPLKQTIAIAKYIYRQKKLDQAHFPLVLMLEPLHACNFTCSGCGRIREYKDTLGEILSIEKCLRAVRECGAPVVSICGGEPLLHPDIGLLVKETLALGKVVYLCTNGWLLERKLDLFEPHPFFNINVHIDGLDKTHDAIVEQKGAFEKAFSSIKTALSKGFTVCTNTTIYKETDIDETARLISVLTDAGVNGILLSPAYGYEDIADQSLFLTRKEVNEKFSRLRKTAKNNKIWSTPIYLDFLSGIKNIDCTPWGNVTYNIKGWKAPCYLITDKHFEKFADFMSSTDWKSLGPDNNKRCANCMVHSGFEPTVALKSSSSFKDAVRMAFFTLL